MYRTAATGACLFRPAGTTTSLHTSLTPREKASSEPLSNSRSVHLLPFVMAISKKAALRVVSPGCLHRCDQCNPPHISA